MKRNLSFPGWMFAVIFSTCLAMSGCLSAPIDIVQGIADATFSVAKTAVDVPLDVAGAVVDIPHTNYKINLTEEREWTFDRGNAKQTDVEACNGSIVVSGTDRDQVVVHAWKKVYARTRADVDKFMAKIDLFAQSEGDRIHAGFHYPPDRRHLSFSIHYEIQVPQAMDLKLTTDNARIQVHHVNGRITARTSNGGIEVADGKYDADLNTSNSAVELNNVEGGFHVETSNAAIRVKQGKGHFTFNTSNGSIELDDSSGRFHARTSNASIRADRLRLAGEGYFETDNASVQVAASDGIAPITIKTSNGSIRLALPGDFRGALEAFAGNGHVKSEFPISVREARSSQMVGPIGNGGETKVYLRTNNGGIDIVQSRP